MQGRGANLERVAPFNRVVVLDAVRRHGATSRVELASVTGLAPQTVTKICRDLLAEGLVVEAGRATLGRGKPRTVLRLAEKGPLAVGVHLDPAMVTLALVDLAGAVVAHDMLPVGPDQAPSAVISAAAAASRELIERSGVAPDRVLGLGFAVPGPIDLDRGVVLAPPNLPLWRDVPARDQLAEATAMPVLLDKDVTSAAVAELWSGGVHAGETAAVVHLGTGIGVGLVADGVVVRGRSGNAGEVGHLVVADGPRCRCGRRGCVAVTASPAHVVAEARAAGLIGAVAAPPHDVRAVFEAAAHGDPVAERIVRDAVTGLARLLASLADLLDLDRVVLGGPYWPCFHQRLLADGAEDEARRLVGRLQVVRTSVGEHAGAMGAASLVLDAAVTPDPHRLVAGGTASTIPSRGRRVQDLAL